MCAENPETPKAQQAEPTSQSGEPITASSSIAGSGLFPKTRWTLVLDAQQGGDEALADLCKDYWRPLYSFAWRMRRNVSEAEDLTQGFFENLLSKEALAHAQKGRGKLRSFLLKSMQNYALDKRKTENALKRGGGRQHVDIDTIEAEKLAMEGLQDDVTPEVEFDRAWARELLSQVFEKLRTAYASAGKSEIFEALKAQVIPGEHQRPYAELADMLGLTEPSLRFAAFKIRGRYRDLLRETIAETVCTPEEVDEELAHLKSAFGL